MYNNNNIDIDIDYEDPLFNSNHDDHDNHDEGHHSDTDFIEYESFEASHMYIDEDDAVDRSFPSAPFPSVAATSRFSPWPTRYR
ncbi:hypothetical protein ACDT12_13335 [Staphylococcus aureus]